MLNLIDYCLLLSILIAQELHGVLHYLDRKLVKLIWAAGVSELSRSNLCRPESYVVLMRIGNSTQGQGSITCYY